MIQKDETSHDARRQEILEALSFSSNLEHCRQKAIEEYNNGGVGAVELSFSIPKSARKILMGHSRSQLSDMLDKDVGLKAYVYVDFKPGKLFSGTYTITIFRV